MAESQSDSPLLDLIAKMTADSLEATTLDARSIMLVRIAALGRTFREPRAVRLRQALESHI